MHIQPAPGAHHLGLVPGTTEVRRHDDPAPVPPAAGQDVDRVRETVEGPFRRYLERTLETKSGVAL
mgnify:CR=1 FL=1